MRLARSLLLTLGLVAFALPAVAQIQQPNYTPATPPETEHLTWYQTQPYGPNDPATLNGVYYGPYSATLASYPGIPFIDLYCIDLTHYAITGNGGWDAWFSPLGGDLTYTRWGNTNEANYFKTAWLASQFTLDNRADWVGINAALWNVFAPGNSRLAGYGTQIAFWDGEWARVSSSYDAQGWYVVTHTVDGQLGTGQEFLTYVTPEPETIFLLGTGLVAVFGMTIVMRRSLG